MRAYRVVFPAFFAVLTAIGAWIKIPFYPVPLTLQVFFVLLSGVLLGRYLGVLSQVIYVFMGLLGLPVFSGTSGITVIWSPTFGYIVGFVFASYVAGSLAERFKKTLSFYKVMGICIAGILVIYLFGITGLYFNLNYIMGKNITMFNTLKVGFFPFILGDVIKGLAVSYIVIKMLPYLNKLKECN